MSRFEEHSEYHKAEVVAKKLSVATNTFVATDNRLLRDVAREKLRRAESESSAVPTRRGQYTAHQACCHGVWC